MWNQYFWVAVGLSFAKVIYYDDNWTDSIAMAEDISKPPQKQYDYLLKFLLVGDSDVGKQEILSDLDDGASESPFCSGSGKCTYHSWRFSFKLLWNLIFSLQNDNYTFRRQTSETPTVGHFRPRPLLYYNSQLFKGRAGRASSLWHHQSVVIRRTGQVAEGSGRTCARRSQSPRG